MTRTMVRLRVAAAVSIGALALAACGSSGSTGGASSVAAPTGTPDVGIIGNTENVGTPVKGGTLTFADYAEARTLDPSKTYATGYSGGTALAAVYDVLVRYDPIKKEFTPQLAKDVKSNADFTQWTVTLRDGAKFSDGTPVDAAAVVSSAKWYLDNKGPDGAVIKPSLGGIRAEGTSTVVFDLTKPWATFPAMLGQGIGMVVAPAGHSGEFKPIGAGAFTMGTYAPKESLVLKANPGYWAGPPNLDELKFVFLNSDETRLDTMKSKGVDAAVLRDARSVQQAKTDGYAGYATVQSLGNAVLINNAPGKPGADPRIREAVDLAIDPTVINNRAFNGDARTSKSVFSEASRWHSDVPPVAFDTAKARQLVDQAKADGFSGAISYLGGNDPTNQAYALAVQAMLQNAGFTVNLELLPSVADRTQRIFVDRNFDLAQGALSVSEEDPFQRLYSNYYSTAPTNATGFKSPAMDKLIDTLQGTQGDARAEVIKQIETLYQQAVPTVPIGPSLPYVPWQADVHGIVPINEGMLLFGGAWKG
jgi:peptide/nickel transport system substrate-binding protein